MLDMQVLKIASLFVFAISSESSFVLRIWNLKIYKPLLILIYSKEGDISGLYTGL